MLGTPSLFGTLDSQITPHVRGGCVFHTLREWVEQSVGQEHGCLNHPLAGSRGKRLHTQKHRHKAEHNQKQQHQHKASSIAPDEEPRGVIHSHHARYATEHASTATS